MAGSTAQGSLFIGGPHSYERRRTQGPEPRRRVGMRGAAMVRIPNPIAKSEAASPRPFVRLRNRVRFAEPDGCADYWRNLHADRRRLRRASTSTIVMPAEAGTQTSLNTKADVASSVRTASENARRFAWIPAFAGMTVGRAAFCSQHSSLNESSRWTKTRRERRSRRARSQTSPRRESWARLSTTVVEVAEPIEAILQRLRAEQLVAGKIRTRRPAAPLKVRCHIRRPLGPTEPTPISDIRIRLDRRDTGIELAACAFAFDVSASIIWAKLEAEAAVIETQRLSFDTPGDSGNRRSYADRQSHNSHLLSLVRVSSCCVIDGLWPRCCGRRSTENKDDGRRDPMPKCAPSRCVVAMGARGSRGRCGFSTHCCHFGESATLR